MSCAGPAAVPVPASRGRPLLPALAVRGWQTGGALAARRGERNPGRGDARRGAQAARLAAPRRLGLASAAGAPAGGKPLRHRPDHRDAARANSRRERLVFIAGLCRTARQPANGRSAPRHGSPARRAGGGDRVRLGVGPRNRDAGEADREAIRLPAGRGAAARERAAKHPVRRPRCRPGADAAARVCRLQAGAGPPPSPGKPRQPRRPLAAARCDCRRPSPPRTARTRVAPDRREKRRAIHVRRATGALRPSAGRDRARARPPVAQRPAAVLAATLAAAPSWRRGPSDGRRIRCGRPASRRSGSGRAEVDGRRGGRRLSRATAAAARGRAERAAPRPRSRHFSRPCGRSRGGLASVRPRWSHGRPEDEPEEEQWR